MSEQQLSGVDQSTPEQTQQDLSELARIRREKLDSLRAEGSFTILDNTVPGYLSGDGRFLMIYTDEKSEKDEVSKAHKAHVLSCFDAFAEKTGK